MHDRRLTPPLASSSDDQAAQPLYSTPDMYRMMNALSQKLPTEEQFNNAQLPEEAQVKVSGTRIAL